MEKIEPNLENKKIEDANVHQNQKVEDNKSNIIKEEIKEDPKIESEKINQEIPTKVEKIEVQKEEIKKTENDNIEKLKQDDISQQIHDKDQKSQFSHSQDKIENKEQIVKQNEKQKTPIKKEEPDNTNEKKIIIPEKEEQKNVKVPDLKKEEEQKDSKVQIINAEKTIDQNKKDDKIDKVTDNIHDMLDLKTNPTIKNPDVPKDKTLIKKIRFQDEEDDQKNAAPGPEIQKELVVPKQKIIKFDDSSKFSVSDKEQQKRLNEWLLNMRSFKFYNGDQLPPPKLPKPKFYSIQIKNLSPQFKMPQEYKDDKKYHVTLSINCTLCDPKIGLFGRTSIFKQNIDENGQILSVEPNKAVLDSWKVFHSDIDLQNTFVISEIVAGIFNLQDQKLETNIGLGILPIKILNKDGSATSGSSKMKILLQSPRIFMTFYDGQKMEDKLKNVKNSPYEIEVSVNEIKQSSNFLQLQKYLQSNCLLSPQDIVPGIINDKIPQIYADDFIDKINYEKTSIIWAHNIKIENLEVIESVFQKYLQKQVADSGFKADVTSRKLTCTLSNSCFLQTLQQVTVDIKSKEVKKGQFKIDIPSAPMKIQNVPSNRLTCLVWRVAYKVKYSQKDSADIVREFILGRNPFFPNFDLQFNSGFINDREVSLTLDMCPELGIINDILWNVNESQVYKEDLYIKISMQLSNTEDLKSEQQQRDLENQFIEQEMQKKTKSKIIEQSNQNQGGKVSIDEETLKRLAQLEIENQKLKFQNQQIIESSKNEKEQLIKSHQKAEMQLKIQKQEEQIEQNIPQKEEKTEAQIEKKEIKQIQQDLQQNEVAIQKQQPVKASVNSMLDVLMNREDTDVRKLIELLQKLIEKTNGNEEIYKDSISKLQQQIIFMLEKDPFSQLSVFGTSGRFKALQFNNLSEEDKLSIIQNSSGDSDKKKQQILNFPEQNYRPKLDIEFKDQFKASTISFKFVAFKTPSITDQSIQLPQRMYYTFKFYMYRQTQTDQVLLRLPKNIAKNLYQQNLLGQKFLKGKQYFLMKYEGKDKFVEEHQKLKEMNQGKSYQSNAQNIDDEYIGLSSNSMEVNFDFDPTSILGFLKSQNKQGLKEQQVIEIENQQHELFCKYLNERVLTIDIWNGDSLMHFGTCKIPLFLLMRQGDQSKVIGQEFDVIDQEFAERIGGLQMVLTNQGRVIQKHKSAYRGGSPLKKSTEDFKKNKKIVTSNPIELHEIQETLLDKVAQFTVIANQNEEIQNDEQLRKQMRVQRLKKLGLTLDGGIKPEKFNDEGASFWEKKEELKKIQLIREQNKANLITKVTMDAEILNQKTINVVCGEANLFELDVNNPFDKKQKFKIMIEDQDLMNGLIQKPELSLVDNEIQEWDFWFKQGKCSEPTKYLEISSKKMNVYIESCQEAKVLFKFQSFREPVVDSSQVDIAKQDLSNELRPRQIKIKIVNSDSFPIFQVLINVSPMEIINDQVFRFYEAQKSKTQSRIPNFIQYISSNSVNTPPLNTCKIVSSNSKIQIETSATEDLLATVENKQSMSCIKGYIYIYQDKFLSQLIGSCKIEIYSLVQIKIKVNAGEEYDYKLNVLNPSNEDLEVTQRIVEVFSSDSTMVYPPDGKNRNNFLLKQVKNFPFQIPICLKSRTSGLQRVRVNIVCINTREIIEQFLLILDADKPIVDQAYKIDCVLGVKNFYKFKFKNPFEDVKANFHIMSSNFKVILPKNDFEIMQPKEEKEIGLIIPEQNSCGNFEAIIHINRQQDETKDNDEKIEKPIFEPFTQSFLFQIKVSKS